MSLRFDENFVKVVENWRRKKKKEKTILWPCILVSKFQRKSQSQNSETSVVLSEKARTRLEELMMEGDLLEVSLDETQLIWRILSHTNSPSSVRKYAAFEEVQSNLNSDIKDVKKRGRKRKSDEFEMMKKLGRQKVDEKSPSNVVKRKGGLNNKDKKVVTPAAATTTTTTTTPASTTTTASTTTATTPGPLKRGPRKV